MFRELDRDGLVERVPLLPVLPRTVSNFISPFLHTVRKRRKKTPFHSPSVSLALCLLLSRNFRVVNP